MVIRVILIIGICLTIGLLVFGCYEFSTVQSYKKSGKNRKKSDFSCRHGRKLCFGKNYNFYAISVGELKKIFDEMKRHMRCFLSGGTLLGYAREGDLLRNDDDLDISFFTTSPEDFKIIERIFKKNGYSKKIYWWKTSHGRYPGQYTFKKTIDGYPIEFDIFPLWKNRSNGKVVRVTFFNGKEVYEYNPFRCISAKFLGTTFNIPENFQSYVSQLYGPSWKKENPRFSYKEYHNRIKDYEPNNITFNKYS